MTAGHTLVEKTDQETRAESKVSLKRIMVGTDFSPASDLALDYAVSLARRFGSRIYLTHILTFEGHPMMEPELAAPTGKKRIRRRNTVRFVLEFLWWGRRPRVRHYMRMLPAVEFL